MRCSCSPMPTAGAVGRAAGVHAPTEPETAHERRERLRDERRGLVAAIARRTGEPHARDQRAREPRGRRRVGRRVHGRAARAREPAARAASVTRVIPDWPPGTVAILTTAGPHAIPVSTAMRAGPRTVLLALGPSRGSLARLREDPRCALALIAEGVAVTLRGRATEIGEAAGTVAIRLDVEHVDDHAQPTFVDRRRACSGAGPTPTRSGATPRCERRSLSSPDRAARARAAGCARRRPTYGRRRPRRARSAGR